MRTLDHRIGSRNVTTIYDTLSDIELDSLKQNYYEIKGSSRECIATSPDYFRILTAGSERTLKPFVMVFHCSGHPEGIIIGRIEDSFLDMRLGRTVIFRKKCRCLIVPEGGVILKNGSERAALHLLRTLLACFALDEFDAITLRWIALDSILFKVALKKITWPFREHHPIVDKHWYTELPSSFELLLSRKTAKHRGNLHRLQRKIETCRSPAFRMRVFRNEAETGELLDDADFVAALSYQRAWGVGFMRTEAVAGMLRLAARQGKLLALVLYADDRPCAFQMGITHDGYHNVIYMAHDVLFDSFNPGNYLLLESLKELCDEHATTMVDYGLGDGMHKRRFGTAFTREANLLFFPPTIDGLLLGLCFSILRVFSDCIKQIARALGIHDTWKRYRRKNPKNTGTRGRFHDAGAVPIQLSRP